MGVRLRFSRALASKRLMYKRQTDSDQPSISFNQFDIFVCIYIYINIYIYMYTSRAARGGGGSFKNRKRIGEIGCCESRMTKRKH